MRYLVEAIFFVGISAAIFSVANDRIPSLYTNARTIETIRSNFSSEMEIKVLEASLNSYGKGSLLITANDKRFREQCAAPIRDEEKMKDFDFPDLNPPIIEIWDAVDNPLEKINFFNLPYRKVFSFSFPKDRSIKGDNIWIYDVQIIDLDNNGTKEIVTRVLGSPCGSGTVDYVLIFGLHDGNYDLIQSLPKADYLTSCVTNRNCDSEKIWEGIKSEDDYKKATESFTNEVTLQNHSSGKEYKINVSSTDDYKKFTDLDGDGTSELIYAHPHCWGLNDDFGDCKDKVSQDKNCHWCAHTWLIGVYKYIDGKYYIDNKWNNGSGLFYLTPKLIDLYSAHGYVYIPGNIFGFVEQYYLEGSENPDYNLYSPYYVFTRGRSEIEEIVKREYGK